VGSERTPRARALVSRALVRLLAQLPGPPDDIVVIGGLAPELLTAGSGQQHQGTGDVDLLVEVGFVYDDHRDFRWLETALLSAGFRPHAGGWRWTTREAGAMVVLELLCERPGAASELVMLPGTAQAAALNLPGSGAARCDAAWRDLADPAGGVRRVQFAGLGGFVLAKSAAAARRDKDKDFYDIVFVLLHNAGGPVAAADAVLAAPCRAHVDDYAALLQHVVAACADESSRGARTYAETAGLVMGEDPDIAAQDAVAAVAQFADRLEASGRWRR
jgi:hypothetical protein